MYIVEPQVFQLLLLLNVCLMDGLYCLSAKEVNQDKNKLQKSVLCDGAILFQ